MEDRWQTLTCLLPQSSPLPKTFRHILSSEVGTAKRQKLISTIRVREFQ